MTKEQIILEIQRTASENGGIPLGLRTFEREAGISLSSWRGKYWRNWGAALKDAGFAPNRPNEAHEQSFLILSLTQLTQKNRCFPTYADMRLERETNKSFPSHQSLTRLGTVNERIELVRQYAKKHPEYSDVLEMLPNQGVDTEESSAAPVVTTKEGYVYMGLLKIGREKRYKIGKALLVERRTDQISIQLPEDLELVHTIRTDDAHGIEDYWHRRFKSKKTKGEWFALSREDVQAFKKRKFM
ncbi:MAG: GIY-YIG nuclease family protein [Verrucomicrobiota bacterium]